MSVIPKNLSLHNTDHVGIKPSRERQLGSDKRKRPITRSLPSGHVTKRSHDPVIARLLDHFPCLVTLFNRPAFALLFRALRCGGLLSSLSGSVTGVIIDHDATLVLGEVARRLEMNPERR